MSSIEFIVPGSGIVNDTEIGSEVIIPGFGIYNEQALSGWTGKIAGITNPAKINGVTVANITKVMGQ